MENIVSEIENLLFASECKRVSVLLPILFSRSSKATKALELLYQTSRKLINNKYIREALSLLNSLKTYSLSLGEVALLTDIKNLLSYCYRLKKKFSEAIQECKDSINICKSKPELVTRLPVLHLNLSAIYREDLKNYARAKFHAEAAYEISKKLLTADGDNQIFTKNLAVSVLTLGQIEECLNNKEFAIMWYSEGIELNNIDAEMIGMFRNRLYGVSNTQKAKGNHDKRSISSRQSFSLDRRRTRVHSKVYNTKLYDSVNTSISTSSQFSLYNNNKLARKSENYNEKIVMIQSWVRMIFKRKEYRASKVAYDYFVFVKKKIDDKMHFVSIYRNITMHKQKFLRRKINSVIYVEAYPLYRYGSVLVVSYELSKLCEAVDLQPNEIALRKNLNLVLDNLHIIHKKLIVSI